MHFNQYQRINMWSHPNSRKSVIDFTIIVSSNHVKRAKLETILVYNW